MQVFWDSRLVFLATPKTGSTAIEAALEGLADISIQRPAAAKHTGAALYRRHLAPYLQATAGDGFETVALMREPLDWLGSWYRYRLRDDIPEAERGVEGMSFDAFVQDWMQAAPPAHADVGSQARFLMLEDGTPGVDRLFAYEEIDRFVEFLEDRLNCAITLPRLNVSPEGPLEIAPETVARHRAFAAAEHALWETLRHG